MTTHQYPLQADTTTTKPPTFFSISRHNLRQLATHYLSQTDVKLRLTVVRNRLRIKAHRPNVLYHLQHQQKVVSSTSWISPQDRLHPHVPFPRSRPASWTTSKRNSNPKSPSSVLNSTAAKSKFPAYMTPYVKPKHDLQTCQLP
jgi:hypothetical protein